MKVNQNLLKIFIFLNTFIFIISFGVVYYRVFKTHRQTYNKEIPKEEIKEDEQTIDSNIIQDTATISDDKALENLQIKIRKPKFVYFSNKAQRVSLIGSFNEWVPQPMQKIGSNRWELTIEIPEGKYLYNFLVDGKIVLDPNNKRPPEMSEKGFKSSVLELK